MKYTICAIGAMLSVLVPSSAAAQPGESGLTFLTLGVSARGLAMGDAMSALATGATSTFYNPASLLPPVRQNGTMQLMFMHREWIQDARSDFVGASIPLGGERALGFSVNTTGVSGIEVRIRPGPSEGTFTARDFSAGLSYAQKIDSTVSAGLTAKFLYEKIFVDDAAGFAADAGVLWRTPVEHLLLGASLCNLGSMNSLRNASTTLPTLFRVGPAYEIGPDDSQFSSAVAADVVHIFPDKRTYVNAGGEIVLNRFLAVRGGYQFGSDTRGLTLGVGIMYKSLALDYAYARVGSDLGNGHTFSLAVNL
jgi:hypothetical protein